MYIDKTAIDGGKLPPQAIDIEEVVLGAFLLDSNAYASFEGEILASDFYDHRNALIMSSISDISNRGGKIDLLTVTDYLRSKGKIDEVGGEVYVARLTNLVASTANLDVHIKIIRQYSIKRSLISLSNKMLRDAYNPEVDVFDMITDWDTSLDKVNSSFSQDIVLSNQQLYKELKDRWRISDIGDGGSLACKTGFATFDKLIGGGFYDGNVITLAGRPGMGKTTIALQIARNVAKSGKRVGIISLEMTALELFSKILSGETKLNNRRILRESPHREEHEQLESWAVNQMNGIPIYYVDAPSMNTMQFKSTVRRLVKEYECEFIVLDYLQLMEGDRDRRGNREQEVASISRTIKSVAKRNKIPILSLSQLNRSVETRGGDKKPQLSDLRESGAIEQDSDVVMFAYRPEYYGIGTIIIESGDNRDKEVKSENKLEIIVSKHRQGVVFSHILECDLRHSNVFESSFEELEPLLPLEKSISFDLDLDYQGDNPF